MKRNVLIFLLIIVSVVCAAQEERIVNGVVCGENHGPIFGAVVSALDLNLFTKTDSLGRFEIKLPLIDYSYQFKLVFNSGSPSSTEVKVIKA